MSIANYSEADLARFIQAELAKHKTPLGYVFVAKQTAPPDAALQNGVAALWLDPTVGASKLMVKAKNTAGTVVTGSVTLA